MIRLTKQRRMILEELRAVKTHPKAYELYMSVKKKISKISLGTVYRHLESMSQEGKILKIECNDFNRFDAIAEPHPHFICGRCQRVFDVEHPIELKFDKQNYEKKTGSSIAKTNIEFHGFCENCNVEGQ